MVMKMSDDNVYAHDVMTSMVMIRIRSSFCYGDYIVASIICPLVCL